MTKNLSMNFSFDIRKGNFNQVRHHTNRTFLNKKASHKDTNLTHIDPNFTPLNISTDGKIKGSASNFRSVLDKKGYQQNYQSKIAKIVNEKFKSFAIHHNHLKSVQRHPKRQIKNNDVFKAKLLKPVSKRYRDRDTKTNLDRYERLGVLYFGDSKSNLRNIKLIQKYYGYKFSTANYVYRGIVSKYIFGRYIAQYHKINPNLLLDHGTTNVDEDADKQKHTPDGLHLHHSIIGLSYTSRHQPSFSVIRGMCAQAGIKYNRRNRIKLKNGHYVNKSAHQALKAYEVHNSNMLASIGEQELHGAFPRVPEFNKITFTRTNQLKNGLSMRDERIRQSVKADLSDKINRFHQEQHSQKMSHRQQARMNRINGASKARAIRRRKRQLRYLRKRSKKVRMGSKSNQSQSKSIALKSESLARRSMVFSSKAVSYRSSADNRASSHYSALYSSNAKTEINLNSQTEFFTASSKINSAKTSFSSSYSASASKAIEPQLTSISTASNSISTASDSIKTASFNVAQTHDNYQQRMGRLSKQEANWIRERKARKREIQRYQAQKQALTASINKLANYKTKLRKSINNEISQELKRFKSLKTSFISFAKRTEQKLAVTAKRYWDNERQAHIQNHRAITSATSPSGFFGRAMTAFDKFRTKRAKNASALSEIGSIRDSKEIQQFSIHNDSEDGTMTSKESREYMTNSEIDSLYPTSYDFKFNAKRKGFQPYELYDSIKSQRLASTKADERQYSLIAPTLQSESKAKYASNSKRDKSNSVSQSHSIEQSIKSERASESINGSQFTSQLRDNSHKRSSQNSRNYGRGFNDIER